MKILVPTSKFEDIEFFLRCGISEFYGGILLGWDKKYHIINSINRRYYEDANFQDMRELMKSVKIIKENKASLFIVLNAPYYVPEQYGFLKKYIKILVNVGVEGFITSDINLIEHIRKQYPRIRIHVSTVATCINTEAFNFYSKFKIDRIVLPRELTFDEIVDIQTQVDTELEVFYSPLGCSGIDGYCGYQHIHEGRGSVCINETSDSFFNQDHTNEKLRIINIQDCRLCQIYDLYKINISTIKIIGRGAQASLIKKNVILLKKILDFLEENSGLEKESFHEFIVQKIIPNASFKCDVDKCLYKK